MTPAWPADDTLVLGVFPRRSPDVTRTNFAPLARYLSEHIQHEVKLETSYDFASFWQNVVAGRYDIVHYNQYHYVRSHAQFGYRVILKNEEFGRSSIAGVILVRADSRIESLADLRGRKVVFGGGRTAMISYIVARYLLRQAGLADGDYVTRFALTPPKACEAVYYRQAAAAGAGDAVLQLPGVRKSIDVGELRAIAISEPLAHLPWAVSSSVSPQLAARIQSVLADMDQDPHGRLLLHDAGLTALRPATDAEFDPHRRIIDSVLGENY